MTSTRTAERVRIDDAVMPIYKELVGDSEEAPFETLKDVFMMSACLGYRLKLRRTLPTGTKNQIRLEVFTESDEALLKAIAIATTGDVQVLLDVGEVLTIAEEHAQAGIHELKRHLLDQRGKALWNLVELINA